MGIMVRYKRLLLKLSGEYLGGEEGKGFNFGTITQLTQQICELHDTGIEIGIVHLLGEANPTVFFLCDLCASARDMFFLSRPLRSSTQRRRGV